MMDIRQKDKSYIANTYKRFDLWLTRGEGSVLYDENDKAYIDLGTGIAVNTFGVGDEAWRRAVISQIDLLGHTSNLYYTLPQIELAELLCEKTGMKKVFFGNSGAEANECMIKVARKYGHDVLNIESPVIISLKNSFHGRTITTLAATGQDVFHKDFGPFTPGFDYVAPDDMIAMEAALQNKNVCGVLMEIIQGEGGVYVLNKDYVQAVAKLCREKNILLMIDEVQTGNGRTGKLFGYMHYDLLPDVISTAKGLGGGLPIGACLMGEKVENILGLGAHGSTFGGNPICAAGALSVLRRLDDDLLAQVTQKGEYIYSELNGAKGVKGISGMGLMIGIETEKPAAEIVALCEKNGVLVLTAKEKVRLLPALNIPVDLLQKAVKVLKEAMA